jgi:SAM-dependent methyltransferase
MNRRAPILTDRLALGRNRARARRAPALFLHEAAADEIEERLLEVNRRFTSVAVVTPFPEVWRGRFPDARIVPDDEVLALDPGAHDLVIHALALHWANDPPGQLIQCRRALRPDGLFQCVAFGGRTLHELRTALAEAEAEVSGGLSPRVAPMADIRGFGALLQRAGLALPVADSAPLTVRYADPLALMRDLRAMGEANALAGRLRHPTRRMVIAATAARYAAAWTGADGRVAATFEMVYLAGWAPHDSQQKPLRPGTAAHGLADALRDLRRASGSDALTQGD